MRRPVLLLPAVLAALLALAAPAGAQQRTCADADLPLTDATAERARAAVLCIVNAERTTRGLVAVAGEGRLDTAARLHSEDMRRRDFFDHESPDGEGPDARVDRQGYPWMALYENIALGQRTPREVMQSWMSSEGHCRGVLAAEAADMGLGTAVGSGGPWWTQIFARQPGSPPYTSPPSDPALACPFDTLAIRPGAARLTLLRLTRAGRRVTVLGRLEGQGAGRRVVVSVRRAGKTRRRTVRTKRGGLFRAKLRAPRGKGRVKVGAKAPGVDGAYATGRARARRI